MSEIEKESLNVLKEILKWIRFSGWTNVKQILLDTLNEPEKLVAYSLTNGDNGLDYIKDRIGRSRGTVQRYWASWQKIGIVESINVKGGTRAKAQFNLEEFGVEIPELNLEEIVQEEEKNE